MRRMGLVVLALAFLSGGCQHEKAEKADEHATAHSPSPPAPLPAERGEGGRRPGEGLITFASGSGEGTGYLSLPTTGEGKKPAVIVIHEWWGLDDWTRSQADRLAQQGYVALAVDLYRGKVTSDPKEAHELSRGLPEDRAMNDLKGAFNYLATRPDVEPNAIGVIGWCMGGGYSLALATQEPRLAGTAIAYGRLVTDFDTIAKINSQVLGIFGGADRGIPVEDVKKFGAELTRAGKLAEIKIYDGAGHAFMNPNNKEGYDAEATKDATARIDRFFARTLRAKIPNS